MVIYTRHTSESLESSAADIEASASAGGKGRQSANPLQSYREPQMSTSSESDSAPAKKARNELENFLTPVFPLEPNFPDLRYQEMDGYPLNLSLAPPQQPQGITENLHGLDLSIKKTECDQSEQHSHGVVDISSDSDSPLTQKHREPILESLWRNTTNQASRTSNSDGKSSDTTDG